MNTPRRCDDTCGPPDLEALSDEELMAATGLYRALRGRGWSGVVPATRAHERELTRRFGGVTTVGAPLEALPDLRRWWHGF